MKIAVCVRDDNLEVFENAGHTPFFAIFEPRGNGAFRSFELVDLRANPRANENEEHGNCTHEHSKMSKEERLQHIKEHEILGEILQDCTVLLTKRACQNTKKTLHNRGIIVKSVNMDCKIAQDCFKFL